jgi:hypothetical protein
MQRLGICYSSGGLSAERAAVYGLKGTGRGVIDGGDYLRQVVLDDAPFNRGQRYNAQPSPGQVLLILKGLISGNEYLKAVVFGCLQKFAVFKSIPTLYSWR